jgi:hypothetical protein
MVNLAAELIETEIAIHIVSRRLFLMTAGTFHR